MNVKPNEVFRVGYFPRTFPRDPVNINTVLEHTLVAQIIESLVNHDADGNVIPGVAQSWKISNDGKEITFNLNREKQFPNGKNVTAKDVKYSIDRHRTSQVSQSREYLKNISQIVAVSSEIVVFTLRQPQVSIFKVLSRSHLGIVPLGWEFNSESDEPIVGTGDYRIIKESGKWHLVFRSGQNSASASHDEKKVNTWEILFANDLEKEIPTQPLADYIPIGRRELQLILEKSILGSSQKNLKMFERTTLAQTAAWWHPFGMSYGDAVSRKLKMGYVRELLQMQRNHLGYEASTGLIPKGVFGYLPQGVQFPSPQRYHSESPLVITVAAAPRETEELMHGDGFAEIQKKYHIQFNIVPFSPSEPQKLKDLMPDIALYTWLGGFADPEGYLPVLTSFLGSDLQSYLGALYLKYKSASDESLWSKRAELFLDFNETMVRQEFLIPAWKPPYFAFISNRLEERMALFKYTPQFTDILVRD